MKRINHYKQALKNEISGIDIKLESVVHKCQQDFLQSYQTWIKTKEKEYNVLVSKFQIKLAEKNDNEKKIIELRTQLRDEEDKRKELQKRKDKDEDEINRLKNYIEQLKDDTGGYKKSAKTDKKKTKLLENENQELLLKVKELQDQLKDEKHKASIIMLNQSNINLQSAMSYGDELIDQSGHIIRFKGFLDHLFSSELKNAEIKNQLVFYFQALESGYRNKIQKLYQQIRDTSNNSLSSSPLGKMSPTKTSMKMDKPIISQLTQLHKINESTILASSQDKQSSRNMPVMKLNSILSSRDRLYTDRGSLQSNISRFSKKTSIKVDGSNLNKSEMIGTSDMNQSRSSSIGYFPKLEAPSNKEIREEYLNLDPIMTIKHKAQKKQSTNSFREGKQSFIMYKGKTKSADFVANDDSSEYNDAFSNLSKSALAQESKIFNDKVINERKCVDLLNKIIFLLNQGEDFPDIEKSNMFFNVTKLFQVNTPGTQSLRRLMYVFIKELKVNQNEVFIVINMLTKDASQADNEMYKANALRVLTKIMEEQYVQTLEKFLKQALIDKSNHVVSAALVSIVNLYKKGGHSTEVAKKSVNELSDKLMNSGDGNLQYQALIILYELKKNDVMSVMKLLYQLTQTKLHNQITKCQLIRYIKTSILTNPGIDQRTAKTFISYIQACLTKEDDSVQFEAAKTMCELFEVLGGVIEVETPFQVLTQLAANSPKPVNKYAALRVMNRIATKQPNLVGMCQTELENLITDMNRSVASLAISTLLKTCNEDSVQKLLKQISHYLPDLGLDFKIETIQSTALLYHRLPNKADVLLKFLTDCLKEESNVQFRESIVDTIIEICPSQRESALLILAEHIEDCEHAHIQTKIINFLAEEGPKSKNPSSLIRFIYNRVNLEKAVIRAAAVSALAAFAHKVPALRKNILLLLQKCLSDSDDEVRERAFFYIKLLEQQGDQSILGNEFDDEGGSTSEDDERDKEELRDFIFGNGQQIDVDALEAYITNNRDELIQQEDSLHIDLNNMMTAKQVQKKHRIQEEDDNEEINKYANAQAAHGQQQQMESAGGSPSKGGATLGAEDNQYLNELKKNAQMADIISEYHYIFSSTPQALNDPGSEYIVQTMKHFFDKVIVVQYAITNTLEDQILSQVKLVISNVESTQQLELLSCSSLQADERIHYGEKKYVYAVFSKQHCQTPFPSAKITQKFELLIAEVDDHKNQLGSYPEDYNLDTLQLAVRDYIRPYILPPGQFKDAWENIGADPKAAEVVQSFQLQFKSMQDAVVGVVKNFGMSVCEGTDKVNVTEKIHNLLMCGLFFGSEITLVRAQIGFNQEYGCVMKVFVRSLNSIISNTILECIN